MKPNVLVVSLDTLRFDCVAAAGERRFLGSVADRLRTPHIDSLAARGAIFTQAVSAAPFTTPSHASLFTGLYPPQHGAHHQYRTPIAPSAATLGEVLGAAGYRTALSAGRAEGEGVMFASDVAGLRRGYQTSIFAGTVDRATRKWLKKARGTTWHLFFHTFAAHWPYGRKTGEVERLFADAWATDDWGAVRQMYVDNASAADAMVGELVSLLDELGELDRTIVVALADHGEGLNHLTPLHGPINGGREEVIRVPMVIHAPWDVPAGVRIDRQVRTVDVLPTILELTGLGVSPSNLPLAGASLTKLLSGGADPLERPAFFAGHLNDDPLAEPLMAGMRTESWKFIIDDCTDTKLAQFEARLARQMGVVVKADLRGQLLREMHAARERVKLFDLAADPRETRNVAAGHPDLVAKFSTEVAAFLGGAWAAPEASEDELLEEQLRALGYLT